MERSYKRSLFRRLLKRMQEPRRFLQVLAGPRQVGKTTLAQQAASELGIPSRYVSADEPTLQDHAWISQQWDIARTLTHVDRRSQPALLIIDEVQEVQGWSETVKRLWDEDTAAELPLRVLLSGSSPLLVPAPKRRRMRARGGALLARRAQAHPRKAGAGGALRPVRGFTRPFGSSGVR